jgi:hypothetical protein
VRKRDVKCSAGWFTAGTEEQLSGGESTYQLVPAEALPSMGAVTLDGSFGWLPEAQGTDATIHFEETISTSEANAERLGRLAERAVKLGLSIPEAFVTFVTRADVHGRVPSCTCCYLDLSERLLQSPLRDGSRMVRFLNDSQFCVVWYLYLQPDGQAPIMAALPDTEEMPFGREPKTMDDGVVVDELVQVATSVEEFVRRFWLENSIWYAVHDGRALTDEQQSYVDAVQAARRERGMLRRAPPPKPWWRFW